MDNNHLKILAFTNNTASTYWRFDGVAKRLNEKTEHEMFVTEYFNWNDDITGANVVILEQLTNPHIVDFCHQKGAKVIFESDDAMIDSYGRERKNLQHLGPTFRGQAIETIRRCDALTVTNKLLAENYARFTSAPIYVLPNYVDFDWYGKVFLRPQRLDNEIRIGWQGSQGHFEDLRFLIPVLKRILEKYSNVRFVYCGYGGMSSDKKMTEIGWGEDVFKELPRARREFYLPTKPELWPTKHRILDLDIEIAPLIDDYFNMCKTNIKWLEAGVLSTPVVASSVLYGDFIKHGQDGLIASNEEEWFKCLSMLIEDKKLRKEIGKNARKRVEKDFDLDKHLGEFEDVYNSVLAM